MQKKQNAAKVHDDLFSPWDDDRQMELVAINSANCDNNKQPTKRDYSYITKQPPPVAIQQQAVQEQAKKTLLHIEQHHNCKKMQPFNNYVDRKKENYPRVESDMPLGFSQFKLPPIGNHKLARKAKRTSKKVLEDQLTQLVDHTQVDNQEQLIFKKYGEHKRKQIGANNVERSFSMGYQPIKIAAEKNELQKKYDTLNCSNGRQKRNSEVMLGELKLKGKKYSYETRSDKSYRLDSLGFIPSQPKITPHYVLFGHSKEDILKKVLQQLQHKFKEMK